ncbi:MAG TPA: hypothetical protein VFZ27_06570 [Terriglobia bacterium]|nr:hypothetical protein [Terriglobia bacterium]
MIVIRNVFRLKFGKTKEALALIKEGVAIQKRAGLELDQRILTDLVGPFYTVVLEMKIPGLSDLETNMSKVMGNKDWQANYQKIIALVDSGYREIFTVVE